MSQIKIHPEWYSLLFEEFQKSYFQTLVEFVKSEYKTKIIYPSPSQIFKAYDLCPPSKTKVIILGQDPYHGRSQANGLCFSVNPNIPYPPSLRNILKELSSDLNKEIPDDFSLENWAYQGVLLLNSTLTVRANSPGSHQGKGWEIFTDATIFALSNNFQNLVFILWGNYAKAKSSLIDSKKHLILTSAHPSPLSAHNGFFGNKHFTKTNKYLIQFNKSPIKWL